MLRTLCSAGLLLFCCLMLACNTREPIKIGFVAGMSGRVADLGVAGRNGVMLAIEQRNAVGGIRGRQVELLARDDEQNPEIARKAVTELLQQQVELLIGPMTSSIAMSLMEQLNGTSAILLSPTVTTTQLTGKDDNFLRVIGDTRSYAAKAARYQVEKLGNRSFAVIYDLDNRSYTESWYADFRQELERLGGTVTVALPYRSTGAPAFRQLATELLSARPQGIAIISNAVDAALICQQLRKQAPQQAIVMAEWASTERFIELAGNAAEGITISQFIDRNQRSERYQQFRKQYLERFGNQEPGFAGLAGYDAALAALDALSARKQGETIKQALVRIGRFQGAQQEYTIDRFGDADRATYVTVVRNGRYLTLE